MSVYQSADQMYACMGELFARIEVAQPSAEDALHKASLVILFRCREPVAEVTIDGRSQPLVVTYGPGQAKPDLTIELTAEALHQILLGELSLIKAVGKRQVKPKGPIHKLSVLEPLFNTAQTLYPDVIKTCG